MFLGTKLYDGIIIDTDDIFAFVNQLHQVSSNVFAQQARELVMKEIADIYDAGEAELDTALIYAAQYKWEDEQGKFSKRSTFEDPLRFSLVMGKTPQGKVLGYPYYGRNEYFSALLDMPQVQPYGYWNNSEQTDGITGEEWKMREAEWDSLLELGDGSFAHLPLYEFPGSREPFMPFILEIFAGRKTGDLMVSLIGTQPSPEKRLKDAFTQAVTSSFVTDPEDIIHNVSKAMRAARSTPVKDMGELPALITLDDLYAKKARTIPVNMEEVVKAVERAGLTPKP